MTVTDSSDGYTQSVTAWTDSFTNSYGSVETVTEWWTTIDGSTVSEWTTTDTNSSGWTWTTTERTTTGDYGIVDII